MRNMSQRRTFLIFAGALVAAPIVSIAQPAQKMRRIGFLLESASNKEYLYTNLIPRLRELGWAEGVNVTFEFRFSEGNNERYKQLAVELVEQRVDLIFTGGNTFTLDAARKATSTIPIVAVGGYVDPVAAGVIQSLARPGGNVTGLTYTSEDLPGKRLQLLKEVNPRLKRVGVLLEDSASSSAHVVTKAAEAARLLGMEVADFLVRDPSDFESAIQKAKKQGVGGLYVGGSPLLAARVNRARLADLFVKYQLPSIGAWNYMAESGFLMGYSPNMADQYRKGAPYIDKILRGANPAEMPMELPTKYELLVNLRTAKALGIKVPQTVLTLADRVIE